MNVIRLPIGLNSVGFSQSQQILQPNGIQANQESTIAGKRTHSEAFQQVQQITEPTISTKIRLNFTATSSAKTPILPLVSATTTSNIEDDADLEEVDDDYGDEESLEDEQLDYEQPIIDENGVATPADNFQSDNLPAQLQQLVEPLEEGEIIDQQHLSLPPVQIVRQLQVKQPSFEEEKIKQHSFVAPTPPEAKRQKTLDHSNYITVQNVPQISAPQEERGMTEDLKRAPFKDALLFNRHLGQLRHKHRLHFSFEKIKNNFMLTSDGRSFNRPPLHQNHNSFLHSNYQPGLTFVNAMNHLTQVSKEYLKDATAAPNKKAALENSKVSHEKAQKQVTQSFNNQPNNLNIAPVPIFSQRGGMSGSGQPQPIEKPLNEKYSQQQMTHEQRNLEALNFFMRGMQRKPSVTQQQQLRYPGSHPFDYQQGRQGNGYTSQYPPNYPPYQGGGQVPYYWGGQMGSGYPQDYNNMIQGSSQNHSVQRPLETGEKVVANPGFIPNDSLNAAELKTSQVFKDGQEVDPENAELKSSSPQKVQGGHNEGAMHHSHNSLNESPSRNEEVDHISSKYAEGLPHDQSNSHVMAPLELQPQMSLHHPMSTSSYHGGPAHPHIQQGRMMAVGPHSGDFMCITCGRGPPHTKKYAKNQCQTCYKKTKKRIEGPPMHGYGGYPVSHHPHYPGPQGSMVDPMDYYTMSQGTFNPVHYPPHQQHHLHPHAGGFMRQSSTTQLQKSAVPLVPLITKEEQFPSSSVQLASEDHLREDEMMMPPQESKRHEIDEKPHRNPEMPKPVPEFMNEVQEL